MIQVKNLEKRYGFIRAVKNISITIEEGDIVGLVGPNGSGKTTTIKSILGLIIPDKGIISIDGRDPRHDTSVKKLIGYVPELPEAPKWMTSCEFLEKLAYLEGSPKNEARKVSREALRRLDLEDYCNYKIGALSKGLKKRLLIAQAIMLDRKYYLLDEPVAGLDPEWVVRIRKMVSEYGRNGAGILISSHILKELEDIINRVIIIKKGSVIFQGTLRELASIAGESTIIVIRSPLTANLAKFLESEGYRVIMITSNMVKVEVPRNVDPKDVLHRVESAGFRVEGFTFTRYSLEDAYLRLLGGE